MSEDMLAFFAKRSTPENKKAEENQKEQEKKREEFYNDTKDFVRMELEKIPDWEEKFRNGSFVFRIDTNSIFKNILSQFIDFKKRRWGDEDPLGLDKSFAEGTLLKKVINELIEEVKKKEDAVKDIAKKEKDIPDSRVIVEFGKPKLK